MNLFDRPFPSAPAAEPSWDKDRNRVMGAREPPGSYGLCWKDLPGDFKCELSIGHGGDCGLEPTPLPITDSRCIAVGQGGHVTNCECRANEARARFQAELDAPGPVSLALQPRSIARQLALDPTLQDPRICSNCYPHPNHAAGSCEYCNCGRTVELSAGPLVALSVAFQAPPKATVGMRRVSHSELANAMVCWRLHYYSYKLRREPRKTAEPLLVGRRVETIIKQIWLGQTPDLSELPPEERAICKAYPIWWRYHTLHVKRVDISFQVEIAGVLYVGEFDGDGEDKGEEVIVELKTTSKDVSPGSSYWREAAQTNPQITIYLSAARAQGRKLRRVVYDVIRKTTLSRALATPLDKRAYTKVTKANPVARLYANMREHDETDNEYELRVLEDIAEKPEKYFQRHDIVRYEDEHQAHLRDVAGMVRLMQVVEEMPEVPRSMGSACWKWGRQCDYLPVCLGEDRIDNNFTYQDRVRKRWGVIGRPDPTYGEHWLDGPQSQGKPREFTSREEAEQKAAELPGEWKVLELPR